MYKCDDCNNVFDEPSEMSAEVFYGVSGFFKNSYGEKIRVCPNCEGSFKKVPEEVEE